MKAAQDYYNHLLMKKCGMRARVIKNEKLIINNGLNAPAFIDRNADEEIKILGDSIKIYNHELG